MYKKCEEILNKLESEGKIKISNYQYPPKQELKLNLKDMLEDEVEEKYYLSEKMKKYVLEKNQKSNFKVFRPHYKGQERIAHTIQTSGGNRADDNFIIDGDKIRKLTPKECWRLMGFDDEDYEKATFKKEISYLEGGIKCNAKLKIVSEKQKHLDMETYVLCTTNDMLGMVTPIQTKWKRNIENENNEKIQNVNIVIEMLGDMVQKECATNIIKCGENITILYILMEELDQHKMAIIELEKKDSTNTGKYMKIILEENLNHMKLYTISTLIEQIIKTKIYTCIVHKANIQGNIAIIEDCKKNLKMMKLSNLKMEYTTRLNSDTMLYKQAGNSIVVNVLEAILYNLLLNSEQAEIERQTTIYDFIGE